MKQEIREYISQILNNELYLLEERTEQVWIDCDDSNKNELKLCKEAIKQLEI